MHVAIIGAAGFLGQKLVKTLVGEGDIGGEAITELTLADVTAPDEDENGDPVALFSDECPFEIKSMTVDIAENAQDVIKEKPDIIFHLAAIVSAEAETNFDKGYHVNLDGTRNLLESIRLMGPEYTPRLVFTSSILVFGGNDLPEVIPDDFHCTPQTSYGTEKAISELLIDDYSRKGYLDGISIRLPTITIRPGKPNMASTSFFSGIIREPLRGLEAICPVPLTFRHSVASPRSAVRFLLYAAKIPTKTLQHGRTRAITMPNLHVSVGDMIASLGRVTGRGAINLIKHEVDPTIQTIVSTFPQGKLSSNRAEELGFVLSDSTFDDVICAYIYDELGGHKYSVPPELLRRNVASKMSPKPVRKRGKAA